MKKSIFLLLLPLLAAAWLFSCYKDSPPPNPGPLPIDYTVLPPATQEGKNTFGCKVNGEVWVPRVELWVPWYDKAVNFNEKNGTGTGIISCRLLNITTDDFFTIAFAANYFQPTTYKSTNNSISQFWFSPDFRLGHERFDPLEDDSTNLLQITAIDTSKNFVSGVFHCTLYNGDKTQTLKITEGRFDLVYYPE